MFECWKKAKLEEVSRKTNKCLKPWHSRGYKDKGSSAPTCWQAISRVSEQLGRAACNPEPNPQSPSYVHIIASANLTAFTVNNSHSGFTGGSLLNLQVELSDILLTWLLQLAGKYTSSLTNASSISFLKHWNWSSLLGRATQIKTQSYCWSAQLPLGFL